MTPSAGRGGAAPGRAEGRRGNLPGELSSFVGREREVSEVGRLLGQARLVTLTGPGGAGKTRLALAVASGLAEGPGDGVWWAGLAPLSDPDLLPQAVAQELGVREGPGRTPLEALEERLQSGRPLLVLDNCEHLIGACAGLTEALLRSCPGLKILATSREVLGIVGERAWAVPPLSVPDLERPLDFERLAGYDAVRLFVDRARGASGFELTEANAPAVARVCRKLEGIPLALELAAARTRVLSPEQISERLEDSLRLLAIRGRTAPNRQKTLRATLDWSHGLLGEQERVLFRRLAAFAGGFSLEAAEAVGAGDGVGLGEVLDLLSGLVEKSLVVAEAGPGGALRYRMLEPVGQYARERLEGSEEGDAVRRRHAAWFLAFAEETGPGLAEARREAWLRLGVERDNIRAALSFTFESGESELGLRLAGALERFWWAGWNLGEGRTWLERVLSERDALPVTVRARALNEAGRIALWQDDLGPAVALFEEGLCLFRGVRDEHGIATSLASLGHAVLHQGDRERLGNLREEAEALREQLTDRWAVAELLLFLGMVDLHTGDHEQATVSLEESMAAFREIGDEGRVATCATYMWMAALERGDLGRAASLLEEDLRRSWRRGIRLQTYDGLLGLAVVAALRDRPARATRLWGAAETLRDEVGVLLSPWSHMPTDFAGRLAATRSRLDRGSWEEAWSEGRAMTLDRAVEYALEKERPRASAPSQPAGLSAREVEVLRLVARGMTNAQVAAELYISPRTVHRHLNSVYSKIGVSSRTAAARFAADQDLL